MANIYDIEGNVIETQKIEEPAYNDIPIVSLTADGGLPKSKDDGTVVAKIYYKSSSEEFAGYATLKVQGSSSATTYPKKNYTVKLYKDSACTKKYKRNFLGWGEDSKFVLKANWIDHTHSRNIVNARLWKQIMMSRSDFDTLPNALKTSQLAVDGFPVKVYGNGVYQGLYTWNLPKSVIYGLDDDIETNALIESEGIGDASRFRASSDSTGSWSDETHDEKPQIIKNAWDAILNFVLTSSDINFTNNFQDHFDKQSIIDQYIFLYTACIVDNLNKNQFFATYDANKWYGAMYDLDGTWGNPCFIPTKADWFAYNTAFQSGYTVCNKGGQTNLLYERVGNLFQTDIKARYTDLRNSVLSEDNILGEFDKFISTIPLYLYEEDYAETTAGGAFVNIPLKTTNNILQIRDFVSARCSYVDSMILT